MNGWANIPFLRWDWQHYHDNHTTNQRETHEVSPKPRWEVKCLIANQIQIVPSVNKQSETVHQLSTSTNTKIDIYQRVPTTNTSLEHEKTIL
mmetsp:Transcript_20818/g.31798  ORF Transcript_20818/g.31798 Transcript_20818/m.31798 type:complete len:92 (+) Transcript_20818:64-339(+)